MENSNSAASNLARLVLRVITLVLLVISLIILCTATKTDQNGEAAKLRFQDVYAYRYMISAIVFGTAYSLLQLAFTIYKVVSNGEGNLLFNFYGDKIISYVLATGAAAGFGITSDMKALIELLSTYDFGDFYAKANASASLLFLAFVCTAILSVLSSFDLQKTLVNLPR